MPVYEIFYLDADCALLGTFSVPCACDKEAKIMAHAMRVSGARRMEVWNGSALVYERPQIYRAPFYNVPLPLHAA